MVFLAGGTSDEQAAAFAQQEIDYQKRGGNLGALRIWVIDRFDAEAEPEVAA